MAYKGEQAKPFTLAQLPLAGDYGTVTSSKKVHIRIGNEIRAIATSLVEQAPPPPIERPLFGLHEPGGEYLMDQGGQAGWVVFTHELGRDPNNIASMDYTPWSRFGIIARLNNGYNPHGTIPQARYYNDFAKRVGNWVRYSKGCSRWIIGNEPNHVTERPYGELIAPLDYAACYALCYAAIKNLPGHENDEVIMAPIAPYYPPEPLGYIAYFRQCLTLCQPNALALHTYSRGSDPQRVYSNDKMGPPYATYYNGFRAYRDFLEVVPDNLRSVPVYVTETNQGDQAWHDHNSGWVRAAYDEIRTWNLTGKQRIHALILYRWPRYDKWYLEGLTGVHQDFLQAMRSG